MGNLRSVEKAVAAVGGWPVIARDPDSIRDADRLILPGVGAFGDAMANLRKRGLDRAIGDAVNAGKPLLGLCLGLQLLFTESEEFGSHQGLDLIPGRVRRFEEPGLRVPHVGWNQIEEGRPDPLLQGIPDGSYFYFVHSFFFSANDTADILSITTYEIEFTSAIEKGNIVGVQFHPEKSHKFGMRLLKNFVDYY